MAGHRRNTTRCSCCGSLSSTSTDTWGADRATRRHRDSRWPRENAEGVMIAAAGCRPPTLGSIFSLGLAAVVLTNGVQTAGQSPHLSVERIASLPSLTGTPPSEPVWSPDGSRLAFLWNDKGWPFRDVW